MIIAVFIAAISPVVRMVVGYPIIDPNAETLVYYKSPDNIIEYVQAWFTTSFFPVFPYMAFFFVGGWIACKVQKTKTGNDKRKLDNKMISWGLSSFIAGVLLFIVPEVMFPDLLALPQWDQPWWIVEISFNIQPMTTCSFLMYIGFSLVSTGLLHRFFDVDHDLRRRTSLSNFYLKFRLYIPCNTWIRFSRFSLTVYILQYLWIPISRIVSAIIGFNLMYSIDDEYVLLFICLLGNVVLGIYVKWLETKPSRARHTIEYYVRTFST